MSVIVTDRGFAPDDWTGPVRPLAELDAVGEGGGVEVGPADDPRALLSAFASVFVPLLEDQIETYLEGNICGAPEPAVFMACPPLP